MLIVTFQKHPVEGGEVEEVGECEGGTEERCGVVPGHQVPPRQGQDPVQGRQSEGTEQTHVDLVSQAPHLPKENIKVLNTI